MADQSTTSTLPPKPQVGAPTATPMATPTAPRVPEFPRPMPREIQRTPEKRIDELTHEQAFDQDFDQLKEVTEQLAATPKVTATADGFEVEVNGTFIDKIFVRSIPQDLRFDAAAGYPLEPRFEITIHYTADGGNMADTLVVVLEELYTKSTTEHVKVIKQRLIEANRIASQESRKHRVTAVHQQKIMDDNRVEEEVRSQGEDVTHPFGYDGLVELEIENAIDAVKTAIQLQKTEQKVNEMMQQR